MWRSWHLDRSPLAPSVPLEGSDTVQGLQAIERLQTLERLEDRDYQGKGKQGSLSNEKRREGSRRARYRRYKGPFLEYLSIDDLKRDPRRWSEFFGADDALSRVKCNISIPASLDLLAERIDENLVIYVCNYIRVALVILLMVTYLRPKAILGILALGYNTFQMLGPSARREELGGNRSLQRKEELEKWDLGHASYNRSIMAIMTWFLMIYSRCMPIVVLALMLSGVFIVMHASLIKSVSEQKAKGKKVLSYQLMEVIRNSSKNGDPRSLFRELSAEALSMVFKTMISARKWSLYSLLWTRDRVKACFRPRDTLSWN